MEDELVWKLSQRLTDLVGDMWGRATLYVVPDPPCSSWAKALITVIPEDVRATLEWQSDTR